MTYSHFHIYLQLQKYIIMKASKEIKYEGNIININGALLSHGLIEKIKELQNGKYPEIETILQEIDEITCDLADSVLDDPDNNRKYSSMIETMRYHKKLFSLLVPQFRYHN